MKKLLDYFLRTIVVAAALFVVAIWVFPELFVLSFSEKILLTGLSSIAVIMLVIFDFLNAFCFEKPQKAEPLTMLFKYLHALDSEKNAMDLRNIRTVVNRKLARSNTNKCMIQATKDLCGKNCKCIELRKNNNCDSCEVYKSYVNYLTEIIDKE